MKLKELIIKNRATRGYDRSREVTMDELREMVDCARLSASSMNAQVLKFYLASTLEESETITANVKFGGALPELGLPFPGTEPAAYIAICQDTRVSDDATTFLKDVGICAQSMSLAATEMGLNCLMIGAYDPENMKKVLGLPDYYTIQMMLAVGKSAEQIELVDVDDPESQADRSSLKYYRKDGVHYTPKRRLKDIIINERNDI